MKLEARKRAVGAVGALRRAGQMPAIVYNDDLNQPISVDLKAFDRVFRSQGTSSVIDLEVDGELVPALVKAVQMDKRRRRPQHADFYAVTADQAVAVHLPVELTGVPIGTRDGGQLDVQRREVYISVLPRLIPGSVEIDISGLAIGDSMHVRDLTAFLPAEAEILDDLDLAIVAVVPPRLAVEDEEEVEEEAEPEVITKGAEDDEGDED
ncbi:MAG: 50S ribosomal protein L25 [Trueperaceae bacterium]